jgi:hypothetical protein
MYKSAIKNLNYSINNTIIKLNKKTNISSTYIGRNYNDTNGGEITTAIQDLGTNGIW